jgi:hypothetical protein
MTLASVKPVKERDISRKFKLQLSASAAVKLVPFITAAPTISNPNLS